MQWRLKKDIDRDFIARFPHVVKRQKEAADERRFQMQKEMQTGRSRAHRQEKSQASKQAREQQQVLAEVRNLLIEGAQTVNRLRQEVQKKHSAQKILEEDILRALKNPELEAVQVR